MNKIKAKKVALAYSGGLDTSIIIPWLKEHYGCEIVAVCGDIGQGGEELDGLKEKALKTGASEVYVEDMREEFVTDYLWKLVRSGAVYEHKYLLGTSIARPLLAKRQAEVALKTGCDALAHGCTGKGNDQVRFELTYKAIAPHLTVIAPWREWDIVSREDAIEYAKKHNVPIAQSTTKIYSRDRNIWHISHEGGELEDPANAAPEHIWMLSKSPADAPDQACRSDDRFRERAPGFAERAAQTDRRGAARRAERDRRRARHRAHRSGREPFRRHEIARLLRDAGRHDPDGGGARNRSAHARPQPRCITSRSWRSITPRWCTTASGLLRCAKRSMRFSKR